MTPASHIVVAAGGTGGHMVPASVLAAELTRRGHRVTLLSDTRGLRFPGLFDGVETRIIPAATVTGRNPLKWTRAALTIARGRSEARRFMRQNSVAAVIGFGGYPALPALLAAFSLRLPTVLHEQNAVLGRVNRLLARSVGRIALSFAGTRRLDQRLAGKTSVVGNPVRQDVIALADAPFTPPVQDAPFHVLVTGGSQGATVLSTTVPSAVAGLPAPDRARLRVVHQCRPEDLDAARAAYAAAEVAAELATYLTDLPARIGAAHLVIARSGASTMAELAVIGRPAILVPFAAATDDHQTANAAEFVAAGGGEMVAQAAFTPPTLTPILARYMDGFTALARAAAGARTVGRADAGARLADIVERLLSPSKRTADAAALTGSFA